MPRSTHLLLALALAPRAEARLFGDDQFETQILEASQVETFYGSAVSVDGTRVAIGAMGAPGDGGGAVYLYADGPRGLVETHRLVGSDTVDGDEFGGQVLLRGDTLVVGAPSTDELTTKSGSVYVFREVGGSWIEEAKLDHDAGFLDHFGHALALDGDTLVVGSEGAGRVWTYERAGGAWPRVDTLIEVGSHTSFGEAVALRGARLVVGEPGGFPGFQGFVHVYLRQGSGWQKTAELSPASQPSHYQYGRSVATAGERILVGAWAYSGQRGAAFVYRRGTGGWQLEQQLEASDVQLDSYFGWTVALEGEVAVIGNRGYGLPGGTRAGAVEVFRHDGTEFVHERRLLPSAPVQGGELGWSIAADRRRIVAGGLFQGALLFDLACVPDQLVCAGEPNSTGQPATLGWRGSQRIALDDFHLRAEGGPAGQPILFLHARSATNVPFGDGRLCLAPGPGALGRLAPAGVLELDGTSEYWLPLTGSSSLPAFDPGVPQLFQALYRDPASAGSRYNLTDAIDVRFCR